MTLYVKDYPAIAPLVARMDSYPYLDIGPGWIPLVLELDRKLAEFCANYKIEQIKEKFGGLRFYFDIHSFDTDDLLAVNKVLEEAEAKAATTCDECGEPGSMINTRGWYHISCGKH